MVAGDELLGGNLLRSWPSRVTLALMIIIFCRAATAAAAFPFLLQAENSRLNSVSTSRTMPVSPLLQQEAHLDAGYHFASRTICIRSVYWRRNGARHRGSTAPGVELVSSPRIARSREAASAELRPDCSSTFSASRTRSAFSVC